MSRPLPFAVAARCISRRGGRDQTSRRLLRNREPAWTRSLEPSGGDQFSEQRPLDRPAEPLPHLVLVREDRGTNADEDELGERLVLVRLPRFVPHLIPSRELAGVPMTALAVVDGDVARHDGANRLGRRREKARQRGVLGQRQNATIDEERLGLIERVELAVLREAAQVETTLPKVGQRLHLHRVSGPTLACCECYTPRGLSALKEG